MEIMTVHFDVPYNGIPIRCLGIVCGLEEALRDGYEELYSECSVDGTLPSPYPVDTVYEDLRIFTFNSVSGKTVTFGIDFIPNPFITDTHHSLGSMVESFLMEIAHGSDDQYSKEFLERLPEWIRPGEKVCISVGQTMVTFGPRGVVC